MSLLYDNSTYHLADTAYTTRLVENHIGDESVVGEVRGWKRTLLSRIDAHFKDSDNRERGYRLYLGIKILKELTSSRASRAYLDLMKGLTLEEVIFWVWQYNTYGKRAAMGFIAMHLSNR